MQDRMTKYDSGVGVIQIFQLNNGMSYFVMGEYHNKGALSPTVGARFNKEQSLYDNIKDAFDRKRLQVMTFSNEGISDTEYFTVNEKQNFARQTLIQNIKLDLSEAEFKQKYIEPMHTEALRQRSASEFFWKLNETVEHKESKFKFKSTRERAESAKKAIQAMASVKFPVDDIVIKQLQRMENLDSTWEEKVPPLDFYSNNSGRKYSELTGFHLMSLADLNKQFQNPQIKTDPEKPTIYIECKKSPEDQWKNFFIFEEEVNLIADVVQNACQNEKNTLSLFETTSSWKNLPSLWQVDKISKNHQSCPSSSL